VFPINRKRIISCLRDKGEERANFKRKSGFITPFLGPCLKDSCLRGRKRDGNEGKSST
jgi:hypothetical protein